MKQLRTLVLFGSLTAVVSAEGTSLPVAPTMAEVLESSQPTDWRSLDPQRTLYMKLESGTVVIELATDFSPGTIANIRTLVEGRYFDGLAVVRSQENYVAQWGDPNADGEKARSLGDASTTLPPELDRTLGELPFTPLPDGDVYAPEVGFTNGFPVARDRSGGRTWLIHCNAMVGVGRGNERDSGNGSSLYAVTGHSPRHLDRNITLVGRVVAGMEHLTTLPRGSGALGFYQGDEPTAPIEWVRLGSEMPADERAELELLRTDTATFAALIDARRTRREEWFFDSVGRLEVCNMLLPTRKPQKTTGGEEPP